MEFPRLIIADERRPGKVPAGVLLAFALKRLGYKLRIFLGSVDEVSLRALSLMNGTPVTLLDPLQCGERENLRWLFETAASEDCLNLIIVNLGGRWSEDSPFRVSKECLLLSQWLDCLITLIPYGDASSMVTMRAVNEIMKQVDAHDGAAVSSILFMALPNPKEYELLDLGIGRQVAWNSMGYIPKMNEREISSLAQLCGEEGAQSLLPIRSAAAQLVSMEGQINWALFGALASAAPRWIPQVPLCPPLEEGYTIAVVKHPSLGLGGNGTELLLSKLGCKLVDISLDDPPAVAPAVNGIYLPHGLAFMCLVKFFSNVYLKTLITRAMTGQFFLLAEGGTSPILGERIRMSRGDEVRGFGLLPYRSIYRTGTFGVPHHKIAFASKRNPLLRGSEECVRGYGSANLIIDTDDPDSCGWELRDSLEGKAVAYDCWSNGKALATQLRLELWSCPELLLRWMQR